MLRDITIGQHFPGNSVVHNTDPRLKILLVIGYIVLLFTVTNLLGLALYTCVSFLPLVSRFGYYLITAHILLVPGILKNMPETSESGKSLRNKKRIMYAATAGFCLLYFVYFLMTAHQEGVRVLPYHSWIFTEKEWLNGSFIF